jgi:hypothetical protein
VTLREDAVRPPLLRFFDVVIRSNDDAREFSA